MTLSHESATFVENIKIEAISIAGYGMELMDDKENPAECASTVSTTSTIKLEDAKVLIKEEIASYQIDETKDIKELLSESVIAAQREAEEYAELADAEALKLSLNAEDIALLPAPKLLQLSPSLLQEKTQSLKAKGQQLDLLLLKAESYSHFILENQRRSQAAEVQRNSDLAMMSPATGKRKTTKSPSKSSSKKTKGKKGSDSRSAEAELEAYDTATTASSAGGFCQPSNLVGGTLMPYQLEGLQWLLSLWENGLSGILADEMGLGKTIQIISLIAYLRQQNTPGPFIVAGPLATLTNWVSEFKKWLPSCPVVLYHGSKSEREEIRSKHMKVKDNKSMSFPVVCTSFEILMIDRPHLEKHLWQYIILDEGHRIKNRNCRLVRELKSFRSISRLLLTGTPIQNTLEELWSLLNFCSPQIFDDLEVFQSWFGFRNIGKDTQVDDIIGTEQQEQVVTKLHEILRPFLLRRLKRDVLLTMPPKKEIVVYCGMSSLQREYYSLVKEGGMRTALMEMGIDGAKDVSEANMLMNLRKVCNHPFLFGEPKDEHGQYLGEVNKRSLVLASGKFKLLDRLLPRLKKEGHKVLIFSQMTALLNILEDYLASLGSDYKYCRLDGSTKLLDRQAAIDKYNKDPSVFIFLLSTRAGGLGINLTAADTCILFDSDWNPHQDSQAQDRCHRIGQHRPVLVYRFLTVGSVEIEMMEKQISKKKLERLTIHGGDYRRAGERCGAQLTISRLRELLNDDVQNLSRMTGKRQSAAAALALANGEDRNEGRDISNEELDLIFDRQKIFPEFACAPLTTASFSSIRRAVPSSASSSSLSSATTSVEDDSSVDPALIPSEGVMYDIITVEQGAGVLGVF